eukprot:Nk52_evm6s256 gene=Nk52_evmTU6s256
MGTHFILPLPLFATSAPHQQANQDQYFYHENVTEHYLTLAARHCFVPPVSDDASGTQVPSLPSKLTIYLIIENVEEDSDSLVESSYPHIRIRPLERLLIGAYNTIFRDSGCNPLLDCEIIPTTRSIFRRAKECEKGNKGLKADGEEFEYPEVVLLLPEIFEKCGMERAALTEQIVQSKLFAHANKMGSVGVGFKCDIVQGADFPDHSKWGDKVTKVLQGNIVNEAAGSRECVSLCRFIAKEHISRGSQDSLNSDGRHAAKTHSGVCLGGTFDHLHGGHKVLLSIAAFLLVDVIVQREGVRASILGACDSSSRRLVCGVVGGNTLLAKKQYLDMMQSIDTRIHHVTAFLEHVVFGLGGGSDDEALAIEEDNCATSAVPSKGKFNVELSVVEIFDPYGPAATDPQLDAIVVSLETEKGGEAVNRKRAENGLDSLCVEVIDFVGAETSSQGNQHSAIGEHKLSSTMLREMRKKITKTSE